MKCYLACHGYEHDLFISYAYGPKDSAGNAPLKNWSTQLRNLLESNLQFYAGGPVAIWFDASRDLDRGIDPLSELDVQFAQRIKGSALLQAHVSKAYLASPWCASELALWVETLPDKSGSKDRRVSVVRVSDTGDQPWPEVLAPNGVQLPGHLLHEPGSEVPLHLNEDFRGFAPAGTFAAAIINLSAVLGNRLKELKRELDQRAAEEAQIRQLIAGSPRSIYLHGRACHRTIWGETRDQLQRLGLEVRPLAPAPDDDEDPAWPKLARIASRCQAMLLVGADQFELDDDLDVIGRDQRNLIQARFQRYLPCAVVDRKGLRSDAFVNAATIRGIEWLDGTSSDWTNEVPPWIARTAATAADKYGVSPPATEPTEPTELSDDTPEDEPS